VEFQKKGGTFLGTKKVGVHLRGVGAVDPFSQSHVWFRQEVNCGRAGYAAVAGPVLPPRVVAGE
jgi:hypothetical protein